MEALCGQLSKKEESSWSDSVILTFPNSFQEFEAWAWDHLQKKCIFGILQRQFLSLLNQHHRSNKKNE